MTHHKFTAK